MISIVNEDQFAWTDVHVDVGGPEGSFHCPALPTVGSGHTLTVLGRLCRPPDDHVPRLLCVVSVMAQQGGIANGLEPCVPVQ